MPPTSVVTQATDASIPPIPSTLHTLGRNPSQNHPHASTLVHNQRKQRHTTPHHPCQNAIHATHISTQPTLASHPCHPHQHLTHASTPPTSRHQRCDGTHASTPPMLPMLSPHEHKYANQATHASAKSTPFFKHLSNEYNLLLVAQHYGNRELKIKLFF